MDTNLSSLDDLAVTEVSGNMGVKDINPASSVDYLVYKEYQPEMNFSKIASKLVSIMSEIEWLGKDATVVMNGREMYKYTSEAQFIAEVRPLMIKHRVIMMPVELKKLDVLKKETDKGAVSYITTILMRYRFIDADSGEFLDIEMGSQGADSTDKGIFKALTGAFKYALRQTFLIGTGDDPEATDENNNVVAREEAVSPLSKVVSAAKKRGVNLNDEPFLSFWKQNGISIDGGGYGEKDVMLANKVKELVQNILSGTSPKDALAALQL